MEKGNFAAALAALNEGKKVARAGWNGWKTGKKFQVVKQKAYPDGIGINANTAEALGLPEGTVVKFAPYLMLCVSQQPENGNVEEMICQPWTPSQVDQLAEDWMTVE